MNHQSDSKGWTKHSQPRSFLQFDFLSLEDLLHKRIVPKLFHLLSQLVEYLLRLVLSFQPRVAGATRAICAAPTLGSTIRDPSSREGPFPAWARTDKDFLVTVQRPRLLLRSPSLIGMRNVRVARGRELGRFVLVRRYELGNEDLLNVLERLQLLLECFQMCILHYQCPRRVGVVQRSRAAILEIRVGVEFWVGVGGRAPVVARSGSVVGSALLALSRWRMLLLLSPIVDTWRRWCELGVVVAVVARVRWVTAQRWASAALSPLVVLGAWNRGDRKGWRWHWGPRYTTGTGSRWRIRRSAGRKWRFECFENDSDRAHNVKLDDGSPEDPLFTKSSGCIEPLELCTVLMLNASEGNAELTSKGSRLAWTAKVRSQRVASEEQGTYQTRSVPAIGAWRCVSFSVPAAPPWFQHRLPGSLSSLLPPVPAWSRAALVFRQVEAWGPHLEGRYCVAARKRRALQWNGGEGKEQVGREGGNSGTSDLD